MTNELHQHPASLRVFFATEMWERYGFYVVQSLLALFLALHYQWPDKQVYALVGSFTALTYLSPVIGGWIADQFLGQKRTILTGAVCLCLSYLVLALIHTPKILPLTLAGIAVGTGLLKPNISSLLGNQYPKESPKREAGFTIFYMGITTGIILGTTLPSQLNHYFGWSFSFASAALGMVISFFTFLLGVRLFNIADYEPYQYQFKNILKAAGLIGGLWSICTLILIYPTIADFAFIVIVFISVAYLIYSVVNEDPQQARKTMVIGLLCTVSVMFWAFYFQMFTSLTLFLARIVAPSFLGINFPPPYYVAIQSFGMLVFGLLLSRKRTKIGLTARSLQTNNKFLCAMVLMCLSYALITCLASTSSGDALLLPLYIIPAYLFISLAELLLSPVGLSAITTLAARHKVSTMMGVFFVSLGIGAFVSGKLANLTAIPAEHLSIADLKWHYAHSFSQLFIILLVATAVAFLINFIIKRLLTGLTH